MLRAKTNLAVRSAVGLTVVAMFSGQLRAGTSVSFNRQANGQQMSDVYLDGNNQQQTYDYTWPDNANWSQSKQMGNDPAGNPIVLQPSNWSQDTYPDGDYDVSLGGNQVTGDISVSVDTLSLSGELDTLGGTTLTVTNGSLVNNGKIVVDWDTSASGTALTFSADATISGTGTITLNNDPAQVTASAGATVTIGSGQTINGLGQISGTFVNDGTIRSTVAAGTLAIAGTMTNNNLIQADDNSTVTFNGTMTNNSTIGVVGNDFVSNLVLSGTVNNSSNGLIAVGGNLYLDTVAIDGGMVWAINAGAYVQASGSSSISNADFNLGGGNHLDILSQSTLTFGGAMTFTNDGTISVNSDNTAYGTALIFTSDVTINGTGDILLTQPGYASQFNASSGATVTLGSSQTLHGTGHIDAAIINHGTISADVAGQSLDIDSYGIENDHVMQATNQSVLNVSGITVTNTNGQISASNQSTVAINSSTIDGGSVSAAPGASIQWNNSSMSGAITLSGTQNIPSQSVTVVNGSTLTNNGKIVINSDQTVYGTALSFDADITLNGSGEILLNSAGAAAQLNVTNNHTLTIDSNQLIHGEGQISGDIVNNGIIRADVVGQSLDLNSYSIENDNVIQANNQSFLNINGITITNTTGQISASNQSAVIITSATIDGGSVSASSDSYTQWNNGTMSGAITLSGTQNIPSQSVTVVNGSMLTNNGKIVINSDQTAYGTALNFDADVTLNGSGEILLNSAGSASQVDVTAGHILTIQSSQIVDGQGTISGDIINYGTISANVSGQTLQITPGIDLANYATLSASNGANLQLTGPFNNIGNIEVAADSTLTLSAASVLNQPNGILDISGHLVLSGSTVDGSTIQASNAGASVLVIGAGSTIENASLTIGSGNHFDIDSQTTLTFDGAMTMTNNGTITVNADNTAYGTALAFNSNVTINGTGDILLTQPGAASQFNAVPSVTVTLGSGQMLHGVGWVNAAMTNHGTINADVAGKSLDLSSYPLENDSVMEATNQSTLNLNGLEISNSGGQITASGQSTVAITGSTIDGGTVSTAADSQISWTNATINGPITLSGRQNITNQSTTTVNGSTLTNNGKIVINPEQSPYGTALSFTGDGTIDGTGEILLDSPGYAAQVITTAGATVTLGSGQTLHGTGHISAALINQGTIAADVAGQSLFIDTYGIENDNLMQATNQSELDINNITVTNTSGQISASNQSPVVISGSTIDGGEVTASADSYIQWTSGTMSGAITLSGRQNITNQSTTTVNGSALTNNGKIVINPEQSGYGTALSFDADVTLNGSGEILLDSAGVAAQLNATNNHTLAIGSQQLIHGQGQINGSVVNSGTIRADVAGQALEITSPLANNGILDIAGGTLLLDQGLTGSTVLSQLLAAAQNSTGIIYSSLTAAHPGTAVGYESTGDAYTFVYTWLGDANLDGVVDAKDAALIAFTGTTWQTGDFNYDGKVNGDDFSLFMLGNALSGGVSISNELPEPAAVILLLPAMLALRRRSR